VYWRTAHGGVTDITRYGGAANWLAEWDFEGLFRPAGAHIVAAFIPRDYARGYIFSPLRGWFGHITRDVVFIRNLQELAMV